MRPDRNRSLDRIKHMLEAVQNIQSFTSGMNLSKFREDEKTYYACLFQFAVIGEAVSHIDKNILEKYDYPWYKVRSFRNFIMHEYLAIDEELVWDTIEIELPGFHELLESICRSEAR